MVGRQKGNGTAEADAHCRHRDRRARPDGERRRGGGEQRDMAGADVGGDDAGIWSCEPTSMTADSRVHVMEGELLLTNLNTGGKS